MEPTMTLNSDSDAIYGPRTRAALEGRRTVIERWSAPDGSYIDLKVTLHGDVTVLTHEDRKILANQLGFTEESVL